MYNYNTAVIEYQLDNILYVHHSCEYQAAQHENFANQGSSNETC